MKKIKLRTILIAVWISVFLMILISSVSAQDTTKTQKVILINQKTILKNQDSIKNGLYKQQPQRKLTDMEKKEMEYREWQQRSKQIDKSMETLDKQSMIMDSLLGKRDTTKIKK